jgi:hypothetical protein
MTDIELYQEVGKWINRYHRFDWFYTGLLKDFQHDLWLLIREKENANISYIKQRCYHYPLYAIQHKYYNRAKDFSQREVVLLNDEGGYVEFAADPFIPFEFEVKATKPVSKYRKNHKSNPVVVTYITGAQQVFNSNKELAEHLGVGVAQVWRKIGKPFCQRFTNRKMSGIQSINYVKDN